MIGPRGNAQRGFILLPVVLTLALLATLAFLMNRESGMGVELAANEARSAEAHYVAEAGLQRVNWQVQNSDCTGYSGLTGVALGSGTYDVTVAPTQGSPVTIASTATLGDGTTRTLTRNAAVVYEAPTSVTLQLGTDPGGDTMIDSSFEDRNHGSGYSGISTNIWQRRRQLLRFDLSGIPAGVTVRSATLELYSYSVSTASPDAAVTVHRVTRGWVEGTKNGGGIADGATWESYDGVADWTAEGGDFDPNPVASSPIAPATGVWVTWPVDSLVQGWVSSTYANDGFLLKGAGDLWMEFYSKESNPGTEAFRPKLTVNYACECGVDCTGAAEFCDADYTPDTKVAEFSTQPYGSSDVQGLAYLPAGAAFLGQTAPAEGFWVSADGDGVLTLTDMAGTDVANCDVSGGVEGTLSGATWVSSGTWAGHLAVAVDGSPSQGDAVRFLDGACAVMDSFSVASLGIYVPRGVAFINATASGTHEGRLAIADGGIVERVLIVDQDGTLQDTLDVSGITGNLHGIAHLPRTDKLLLADWDAARVFVVDFVSFAGTALSDYDVGGFGTGHPSAAAVNLSTCDHAVGDNIDNNLVFLNGGAGRVLLVVSDVASPTTEESARRDLIESWNFAVSLIDDGASVADYDAARAVNDVVYVSEEVDHTQLYNKLTKMTIGVVSEERMLYSQLGFSNAIGTQLGLTEISVTNNTHDITSGFGLGTLQITASGQPLCYLQGTPSADLVGLANHATVANPNLAVLDAGDATHDGDTAAGRRVWLPWGGDTFEFSSLNTDGQTIMRRAIEWGAGAGAAALGPVAHWKLDEAGGPTAVDSEGGHDGTWTNGPSGVTGAVDGGLSFDGSNDYVDVPHAEELAVTGVMTFAAWAKTLDTSGGTKAILAKDTPGNGLSNYWFGISNDELVFGFYAVGGFQDVQTPNSNLQTDTWYHLAASFNDGADEVRLYVDGVEAHVGAFTHTPTTETADLWIGHSVDGEYWNGTLDDIRIYNAILSAAEVAALASAGGSPPSGGPLTLNPVADAAMYEGSPNTNYGTQETMRVGEDSGGQIYRSLLRFDVSSVPADATVSTATLRLYITASTGNKTVPVGIYGVTETWEETVATWNTTGGGTYDPTQLAESDIPKNFTGWVEWSIPRGLIHEWVDGVTPNHGVLLNYEAAFKGNFRSPATRENAVADQRPQLVIEYVTLVVLPPPEPWPEPVPM